MPIFNINKKQEKEQTIKVFTWSDKKLDTSGTIYIFKSIKDCVISSACSHIYDAAIKNKDGSLTIKNKNKLKNKIFIYVIETPSNNIYYNKIKNNSRITNTSYEFGSIEKFINKYKVSANYKDINEINKNREKIYNTVYAVCNAELNKILKKFDLYSKNNNSCIKLIDYKKSTDEQDKENYSEFINGNSNDLPMINCNVENCSKDKKSYYNAIDEIDSTINKKIESVGKLDFSGDNDGGSFDFVIN